MAKENITQEFRLKNIEYNKNYFIEKMSKIHKKICTILNYIEQFLVLASAGNGCISISAFTSLLGIHIGPENLCNT